MSDVTDLDYCPECKTYLASLEVHNDFWHQEEPTPTENPEKWDNSKFVLVMQIKHKSSDSWWMRVFGPFDTRHKAIGQKKRILRAMREDYRTTEWIEANVKFSTTSIWKKNG